MPKGFNAPYLVSNAKGPPMERIFFSRSFLICLFLSTAVVSSVITPPEFPSEGSDVDTAAFKGRHCKRLQFATTAVSPLTPDLTKFDDGQDRQLSLFPLRGFTNDEVNDKLNANRGQVSR